MLNPSYLAFMVRSVGIILARSMFHSVCSVESNQLIMVSLYMQRDPEAYALFKEQLEEYGDYVCEAWNGIHKQVAEFNRQGFESVTSDVNSVLERIRNADWSEGTGR